MRLSKRGTVNWASTFNVIVPDEHPMHSPEYQQLCTELRIPNAVVAAELFGMSWRTCQRYWYGELTIPGPLARLLRMCAAQNLTHDEMRKFFAAPKPTRRPARK